MKEISEKDLSHAAGGADHREWGGSNMYGAQVTGDDPACGGYNPKPVPADLPYRPKPNTCGSCEFFNSTRGTCMCMNI